MSSRPISNKEKYAPLGMNPHTAKLRLRKRIIFDLIQRMNINLCHRCGKMIESARELGLEHKQSWYTHPQATEIYFDVGNIIFTHIECQQKNIRKKVVVAEPFSIPSTTDKDATSRKISSTGYKHVYHNPSAKKPYRVRIKEDGKLKSFGTFASIEEAVKEVEKQVQRLSRKTLLQT